MGQLSEKQMDALETALEGAYREGLKRKSASRIVLDRTCDWVIDEERDMAVCRQHGEVYDGVRSERFPGAKR